MTGRRLRYLQPLFIWLALALTVVAAADVVEDVVVEAAEAAEVAGDALPEVENPVENVLVPSHGTGLSSAGALSAGVLSPSVTEPHPVSVVPDLLPAHAPDRAPPPRLRSSSGLTILPLRL